MSIWNSILMRLRGRPAPTRNADDATAEEESNWGNVTGAEMLEAWPRDVPAGQLRQRLDDIAARQGQAGVRRVWYGGARVNKLLDAHPQLADWLVIWGEARDTKLAQAIATVSKPDITQWAAVLEQRATNDAAREFFGWAYRHPRDAQDVVRGLARQAGVIADLSRQDGVQGAPE